MISTLLKNATYNSISWLIAVVLSLASTSIFVKILSIELYGIYILLISLVAYYNILDLGLGQGITKYVSQYIVSQEVKKITDTINCAIIIQIVLGFVGSFLLFFFASNIIEILKVSLNNKQIAVVSLKFCSLGFFFTMITATFTAILNGLQRFDVTARLNILYNFCLTMFSIITLFISKNLLFLIQVNVIISILTCIGYYIQVKKYIPFWNFNLTFGTGTFKQLFSFSKYIFFSRSLNLFNNYLIRFVIGGVLGPSSVTYFTIPSKLISAIGGLLSNASIVLIPFASELNSKSGKSAEFKNIYLKSNKLFNIILIPLLLSIAIFSKTILAFWVGLDIAKEAWPILSLLCFSSILGAITTIPINIILGIGNVKPITYNALSALLIYVLTLYPAIHVFNLLGVPITMILAAIPGLLLLFYVTKKIFLMPFSYFLREVFGIHIIISIIAISSILITKNNFKLYSPYCLMMFLFFLIFYFFLLLYKYANLLSPTLFKRFKGFVQ